MKKRVEIKPLILKKRDVRALDETTQYCIKLIEAQHTITGAEISVSDILKLASNFLALYNVAVNGEQVHIAKNDSVH